MHNCDHYNGERYPHMKNRKFVKQEVDAVVVGLGAAGGVLLSEVAGAGFNVAVSFTHPTLAAGAIV